MSVEHDLHLYGLSPGDGDLVSYWTSPNMYQWWMPLRPQPACHARTHTCPNIPTGHSSSRFVENLINMFPREQNSEERVNKHRAGTCPAAPEDMCVVNSDALMDDIGLALMTLFSEQTPDQDQVNEDGFIDNKNLNSGDNRNCPILSTSTIDNDKEDANGNDGDCNDNDDILLTSNKKVKVKFADDVGLPLTAVHVFECCSDEEEGDNHEEACRRSLQRILRKKHLHSVSPSKPIHNYTRYYKPYREEYVTSMAQEAGTFSMVAF